MPHPFLNEKYGIMTAPAAIVDDASLTTTEIDTIGYDYLKLIVIVGATDIALTALTVTESDTAGSGHAAISDLTASGTTGDSRLPQATDDNGFFCSFIDLKGRKRYIDATITVGNGTAGAFVTVIYILSRAKTSPLTAAQQGLKGRMIA